MNMETRNIEYFDEADLADVAFSEEQENLLYELNNKIAGRQTLGDVLDYFFDSTMEIYPCDRISVAFLEEDGQRLVSYWTRTLYEDMSLKTGYAEDVRSSSLRKVLWDNRIRIISDIDAYHRDYPHSISTRLLVREGIGANLTCPLRVGDRVVGALFRSSRNKHAYNREHAAFHHAVGERLSQAVEKAYLIDKLDRRNRDYMEMLAFVSHELKNPVATIMMNADILRKGFAGGIDKEQRETVERIFRKGTRLNELIAAYLDLARIEGGGRDPSFSGIDFVSGVVRPAIEESEELVQDKRMNLSEDLPSEKTNLICDAVLMKSVITNLISNAVKYGRENGRIDLSVKLMDGRLRLIVRNEGAGFREEDRNRLFKRFSRLPTPDHKGVQGTGVGLYTCWRIVNMHKGKMIANSEYGKYAEFGFIVPLNPDIGVNK